MRALAAATALAACLTLAACSIGGGGSDNLSRAELIARGDAICTKGREAFKTIQAKPPHSAKQAATQTKRLVATTESEVVQLRALKAPDELRAPLSTYLSARQEGVAVLKKAQAAAENKDAQAYANATAELRSGQARRYDLARKVGFKVCSNPKTGD